MENNFLVDAFIHCANDPNVAFELFPGDVGSLEDADALLELCFKHRDALLHALRAAEGWIATALLS